ncbi:MAG: hypothetical protein IT320_22245 [Anaerolineae bacterium]|nr:hypothetical protein [Anaerolineae bacterium]
MNRISAGGNLSIEIQPHNWRLLANGADLEHPLVEVSDHEPLRYIPAFGSTRRLPDTGILPTQYIQRIVLGWSHEDAAWHLGFLLEPELARPRGSRWCELVHWPDPDGHLQEDAARLAAESLAQTVDRPFHFVPPRAVAPVETPVVMPTLPEKLDDWSIRLTETGQIEAVRDNQAGRSRFLRGIWYLLLSIIYLGLSGLTLTSGIALPRPEILPYVGLAAALLLFILALRALLVRDKQIDRLVVHPEAKAIRGLSRGSERWRHEVDDLQAVYISQVVQKPRKNGVQTIAYGELNLQLSDGQFQHVLEQGPTELKLSPEAEASLQNYQDGVFLLTAAAAQSSMQVLGLQVSQMLGIPCYYDARAR